MSNRERLRVLKTLNPFKPDDFVLRTLRTDNARKAGYELLDVIESERMKAVSEYRIGRYDLILSRDQGFIEANGFGEKNKRLEKRKRRKELLLDNIESICSVFFGVEGKLDRYSIREGKRTTRFELGRDYGFKAQFEISDPYEDEIISGVLHLLGSFIPLDRQAYKYLPDGYCQKDAKGRIINTNAKLFKTELTADNGIVICGQEIFTNPPLNPVLLMYPLDLFRV